MDVVAVLIAGFAVALLSFAVLDTVFSEERRVRRRLHALDSYSSGAVAEAEPLLAPFRSRVLVPAMTRVAHELSSIAPKDYTERLRARMLAAGSSARQGTDRVLLAKLALGIAGFAAITTLAGSATGDYGRATLYGLSAAFLLSYIPDLVVKARAEARMHHIARELPDMLDMLTIAVEAGLGFDQAVSRYVQNASGPLAREFGITLREIQAGKSRRDAMRALGDRTGAPELRLFIMAIVQADVFGVSVADTLRTQSHEMRLKRRQLAEELAQRAPAKMVFPLILCIMPATLIVVMGPAVIRISRAFFGM